MAFYSNDEYRENPSMPEGSGMSILAHYSDGEFPRLLYRATGEIAPANVDERQKWEQNLIQGKSLDTLTVNSEDAKEAALAEGWHLTPMVASALDDVAGEVEMARRGPGRPRKEL